MRKRPIILYADDDPDDRELLRDALNEKDSIVHIIETVNGREVLLYLQSSKGILNPPSLILLD